MQTRTLGKNGELDALRAVSQAEVCGGPTAMPAVRCFLARAAETAVDCCSWPGCSGEVSREKFQKCARCDVARYVNQLLVGVPEYIFG
jgi:hypothetical protein